MKDYRDLVVWQRSMDLVVEVYKLVKLLLKEETYALSDQMRRAVISIPSNIAEGYGRESTRDYVKFLKIARGSCYELETQFEVCIRVEYLTQEKVKISFGFLDEITKMLNSLARKLSDNIN